MKKLLMSVAVLATAVFANAQTPADFVPYKSTKLRLGSVDF